MHAFPAPSIATFSAGIRAGQPFSVNSQCSVNGSSDCYASGFGSNTADSETWIQNTGRTRKNTGPHLIGWKIQRRKKQEITPETESRDFHRFLGSRIKADRFWSAGPNTNNERSHHFPQKKRVKPALQLVPAKAGKNLEDQHHNSRFSRY